MKPLALALQRDVDALCTPDGRRVGTAAHDVARSWLVGRAREVGLAPYGAAIELPFETPHIRGCNVVGVVEGADRSLPPVVLAAHYDSVIDAPCADDNAAAVAILLALVPLLRAQAPGRDVVFAFFDAEEPPYFQTSSMGSVRFVEDQMDARGTHCAVVLDLMGHDVPVERVGPLPFALPGLGGLRQLVFVTGAESHEALAPLVRGTKLPSRLRMIATRNANVGDMSDHFAFRAVGVPFLFFSCGRWQHYHQPSDTPDRLNYKKMARFVHYLVALLPPLLRTDLTPTRPGPYEVDTVAFEIDSIRAALGPLLPILTKVTGIGPLQTREDLDDLAEALQSLGL